MMVLKVFLFLAALALVSLPTCCSTVQQEQAEQKCVSKDEFDSVVTQTAAVESELNTWQNTTINILKRFLLENPALLLETVQDKLGNVQDKLGNVQDKLEIMQYKMQDKTNRLLDDLATLRNTTMDALTDLQHQIKQQQNKTDREMAALKNTIMDGQDNLQDKVDTLQDKVVNLQDKLDTFQNTTEASTRKHHHEVVELLQNTSLDGQANVQDKVDTLQDKVINLQDKLNVFHSTTEASTRKHHHEVVELLQNNTSCSLDGTEELHKQLENITEGLQDQLQSCNRTDISIQYLPASCSEIAELNPHSPPGYYKISTTSGAVYCSMITPDNPASSCLDIATQHPLASSGYYWVNSSNGTAVQVYCSMTTPDNPASSCQDIATRHPLASSGYYWVNSSNGTAVQVYCSMTTPDNPASSCQDIATRHPLASSGYYWVNSSNGTAVQVYCDMERHCCGSTGGWMRAAYLDMTDPTHHCPTGFRLTSHSKRSCERITRPGCTGLTFAVQSVKYSKVCGKVIAYQYGSPDAFEPYYSNRARALDGLYVDGVSITHGHPRRHIWTFAAALDETRGNLFTCPCTKTGTTYTGVVPPFLGNDYFCDTGSRNIWQSRFYPDDPLWDGRGCGPTSSCCSFNSPPWFCKELPQHTTDDIEVRVCTDEPTSNEDITIEAVELYVQ